MELVKARELLQDANLGRFVGKEVPVGSAVSLRSRLPKRETSTWTWMNDRIA